jgi:hypothetical protein
VPTVHATVRISLLLVIATIAGACGSAAPADRPSAPPSTPPASFGEESVRSAEEALAAVGVEVKVLPSDEAPQVTSSGELSTVRFLRFQVRNMALELSAGAGTPAEDLDTATEAGGGAAVTPLMVGWLTSAGTPAAALARSAMGDQDLGEPKTLMFPTLAIAAFLADATRGGTTESAWRGAETDIQPAAFGAPANDLCSQVSSYLGETLQGVLDPKAEFDVPWLKAVIDQYAPLYGEDPDLFRRTVGALALLAYATSVARSWTVLATPDPSRVAYSIEGEASTEGEVRVTVEAGGSFFAEEVRPCASLARIELDGSAPTDGASVGWDTGGLAPHATAAEADDELEGAQASLTYETTAESRDAAEKGSPRTAEMTVLVAVERSEMENLDDAVSSILLDEGQAGPLETAVKALYQEMQPTLVELMTPKAVASIEVTFHTLPTPSPTEEAGALTGTWLGTWQNGPSFGDPPAQGGFTLTLEQQGGDVFGAGEVTGATCIRHVTVSGSVQGSTVELSLSGARDVATFSATLEGDSMSGTWSSIACGTTDTEVYGTWQAERE